MAYTVIKKLKIALTFILGWIAVIALVQLIQEIIR